MRIPLPSQFDGQRAGAYLVGGCVRDLIRGLPPRDFDIAVSDDPRAFAEETAARLGGRFFVLGKGNFTVFCVAANKVQIDIIGYKGSNIQEDLLNRDFTVNALACRLTDGRIVDVTGGLTDLQRRKIRMVAPNVFRDDPVRLVRAFRMAATLNFNIEPETLRAIRDRADLLQQTAPERIWAELRRILSCPNCHQHIRMMYDYNVLQSILPELTELDQCDRSHPGSADGVEHAIGAIRCLEQILGRPEAFFAQAPARCIESLAEDSHVQLKMAMLLQDIGKPQCRRIDAAGRIHHYGHAARGAELVRSIGRRLRLSKRHRESIASLVRRHQRPLLLFSARKGHPGPPPIAIGRFFQQCGLQTPHLLLLAMADNMTVQNPDAPHQAEMMEFIRNILAIYADRIYQKRRSPILNGKDLILGFGLEPSPAFGTLLRRVDELYLAGVISDRNQALRWVAEQLETIKNTPGS